MTPRYAALEIEGHMYPVRKNGEIDHLNVVLRLALLKLSPEKFVELQRIEGTGPVRIRRVGIDSQFQTVLLGNELYWSRHEEKGEQYYKKIISFYPTDVDREQVADVAPEAGKNKLLDIVVALYAYARFDVLASGLSKKGALTDELRVELLDGSLEQFTWQSRRVDDAEDKFNQLIGELSIR